MSVTEVAITTVFGLGAAGFVALGLVLTGWRRSENEYARWRQRRGEDEHEGSQPSRPWSHWGGLGRPGS